MSDYSEAAARLKAEQDAEEERKRRAKAALDKAGLKPDDKRMEPLKPYVGKDYQPIEPIKPANWAQRLKDKVSAYIGRTRTKKVKSGLTDAGVTADEVKRLRRS